MAPLTKNQMKRLEYLTNAVKYFQRLGNPLIAINNQLNDANIIHNDDIVQQPLNTGSSTFSPSSRSEKNEDARANSVTESAVPLSMSISCTLDMIITIVGEFYGQRDLLDGREVWGEQT